MGKVYRARDARLGRTVAIKFVSEQFASDSKAAERLAREARLTSALNHPNIVTVFDVGEDEGRPYIVMELVNGRSLSDALAAGALGLRETVEIATQVADGLAAAHAAGVVHRDVKPRNIMLTEDGRPKIVDFGLGKGVDPVVGSDDSTAAQVTEAHMVIGTVGYMAPEQVRGQGIDGRADQFALGAVIYEMLTGRRAFKRDSGVQTLAAIVEAEPEPLRVLCPEAPVELVTIVQRCLAKSPAHRYASTLDLARDLHDVRDALSRNWPGRSASAPLAGTAGRDSGARRRTWPAVVAAAVVISAAGLWFAPAALQRMRGGSNETRPVVAVMPFVNLSGADTNDHLSVGFADSLISDLSRMPALVVVGREVARQFRGTSDNPKDVARNLGADLLVAGSIQKNGARIRINWDLIRDDGTRVSSDSYEGDDNQIFDLQRRLAGGIAAALHVDAVTDAAPQTSDVLALDDYWRGRVFLGNRDTAGNVEAAIQAFSRALSRDPDFVAARAALGVAAAERYRETKDQVWMDKALEASQAAAAADANLPEAQISLARVYMLTGRTSEAVNTLTRLLERRPDHDEAMTLLGDTLVGAGQRLEGIAWLERAVAQRPRFPNHHTRLAVAYFRNGDYHKAIAQASIVTVLQPDNARGFQMLGASYQAIGDKVRAVEHYTTALRIAPSPEAQFNLGVLQFSERRYAEAAVSFEGVVKLRPNEPINHRTLGDAYRRLGFQQKAAEAYERAVALSRAQLKVNPTDAGMVAQLAVSLAKLGHTVEAEDAIGKAVSLAPTDSTVRLREAVVYAEIGKRREALAALEAALKHGYGTARVADDEDLAPIRDSAEFKALLQQYGSPKPGGS